MCILARVFALVLITSLALPLTATHQSVLAKNHHRSAKTERSRSVRAEGSKTLTFSNTGAITIPAVGDGRGNANPFPSTIQASGFNKGTIQDVNVSLNGFSHEFPEDVHILLQSPNGRVAIILANSGGAQSVTNLNITLDDEAPTSEPFDGPLVSGTFQPTVNPFPAPSGTSYPALLTFDGGNPNGTWQLFVADDSNGDVGSISGGWSITIQAKIAKKKKH
jgi:subtilisin-like proprotein convertase family protein